MNYQDYSNSIQDYFYNLILIFPFLISYEILGLIVNYNLPFEIRNGADVLLRQAFLYFGIYGKFFLLALILIFPILIFLKGKNKLTNENFKSPYLFFMIFEGIIFGAILFFIFKNIPDLLIVGKKDLGIMEKLYLIIGAGIFEEFIFRFIPIGTIVYLFYKLFKFNFTIVFIPILIFSSFVFSGFHYIGTFGDYFDWSSFLLRFSAGIYLGAIFQYRGFGICVITHIFYDFLVINRI